MADPHDSVDDEGLFAQLFEAGPDGELVAGEDGRVRLANAEAHRILGWPQGTLIEHQLSELLPERFHATNPVTACPSPGSPRRMGEVLDEFITHRRDGTDLPVEITTCGVHARTEE